VTRPPYKLKRTTRYLTKKERLSAADKELVDGVEKRIEHNPGTSRYRRQLGADGSWYDYSESPIVVSYRLLGGYEIELLDLEHPGHHGRLS